MTVPLEQFDEELAPEELTEIGSFNHGYLQLKIGAYFLHLPDFTPSSELSLDTSSLPESELSHAPEILKPDIAVYEQRVINFQQDVLKTEQMPVLVIEILSPMQGVKTLVDKFRIYFALGVRSCWLVYPYAEAVAVYHAPDSFTLFAEGEVVDEVAGVRVPIQEIFS